MTGQKTTPTDSRDMYIVHNMLRRAFGELPALVRGVEDGSERARTVADHARLLVAILSTHHEAEDEVLWPILMERCPAELTPMVATMEEEHQQLHTLLDTVSERAEKYSVTASAGDREDLARATEAVVGPMHGHLVGEERNILPLIDRYCTDEEWASVGEHGLPQLTPTQVPLVFGMMLRVATEDQRAVLAAHIPDEVLSQMVQIAPDALNAYERTLHGFDTSERPR
ncbi:hemerythrin domain-containing protein [Spiractinospora alimapuensis]|uniref:hemerythrin domain-containing protein n=1 Tax=Spiractinospora alimapuensis TaxID=2820884 RepID=UPI001F3BE18D|nr:hemerythrin domain-containing protein [Spiractinospora alimapuensis]QVQ52251.1 hemerythrin domain-containing protein [Spiractinospora alimapuensis]